MLIDLLTTVNAWMFRQSGFKGFVNFLIRDSFTIYSMDVNHISKMTNGFSFFVLGFLVFLSIPIITDANAHSLFNSAEQIIGGYRVQIATLPEFPNVGGKSQIIFQVQDVDFNELDRFTMGVRVFFNDELVDEIKPKSHEGGHWQTDYVFKRSGNHIFRVDLYDLAKSGVVLTYTFNMSTQSPFGYIFFFSIMTGSVIIAIILVYIYLPNRFRKLKSKF